MANNSDNNSSSTPRDLGIAVAAALTVRLLYLLILDRAIDMADAIHYITMAQEFATGDFFSFDENLPILYSALGATAHILIDDWEWAFWSVSLVASTLTVIPVYLLAHELHDRSAARNVAALITVWPWLVDYASRIAPEALAVLLWFSALWFTFRAVQVGGRYLVFAVAVLFALHLTRPEGTFLLLASPITATVLAYRRGKPAYRRVAVLTAACLLSVALYALAMRAVIGSYTVSYRAPMAGDLFDYFQRGAIEGVRTFMRLSFDEFPVMLGPILLVFLGIGLYEGWPTRRPRLALTLLLFCAIQFSLTVANFSPAPRYIMTLVIAAAIPAAHGIAVLALRLRTWRSWAGPAPVGFVIASLLLGLVVTVAPDLMNQTPRLPREYRIAGNWMRENLEPGIIICRKPQVGFYAGMPTTGPALTDTPEDVVARAMAIGARYLVLDERYTAQMAPALSPLLDPANAPPTLRILSHTLSSYPGARIAVYEFNVPGLTFTSPEDAQLGNSHRGPDEKRRKNSNP